jgi:uncharacterized protein YndB with AHSA1/START domain
MPDIRHSITIDAPPERVYPLVTSAKGLSIWWAEDASDDSASGTVSLGFFNRATVYRLKQLVMATPLEAEWICESGKEWSETRLIFRLKPDGARTRVRFTHADWAADTDYFVDCTTTWGGLMFRLKAAAEGKSATPLFSRTGLAY